jgi:hypothetical protein
VPTEPSSEQGEAGHSVDGAEVRSPGALDPMRRKRDAVWSYDPDLAPKIVRHHVVDGRCSAISSARVEPDRWQRR